MLKIQITLPIALLALAGVCDAQDSRPARLPQRILYIGDSGSPRAKAFNEFLGETFSKVAVEDRANYKSGDADAFDVVLLDWPQTPMTPGAENSFPPKISPIGNRANWNKPMVLLGSAGLMLSCVWGLKAGAG
ncbi:MAG: hypothetical protein HY286_11830 [Planctomycetes bacterium]|nr:hypothetical protein [Planctomycetota bacterium]